MIRKANHRKKGHQNVETVCNFVISNVKMEFRMWLIQCLNYELYVFPQSVEHKPDRKYCSYPGHFSSTLWHCQVSLFVLFCIVVVLYNVTIWNESYCALKLWFIFNLHIFSWADLESCLQSKVRSLLEVFISDSLIQHQVPILALSWLSIDLLSWVRALLKLCPCIWFHLHKNSHVCEQLWGVGGWTVWG